MRIVVATSNQALSATTTHPSDKQYVCTLYNSIPSLPVMGFYAQVYDTFWWSIGSIPDSLQSNPTNSLVSIVLIAFSTETCEKVLCTD